MGSAARSFAIEPASPLISYQGQWNMSDPTSYRPIVTYDGAERKSNVASATLWFSGSGVGWRGEGDAGSTTADGIFYQIDKESTSPYNTTFLLSFRDRNDSRGDTWSDMKLPPGEHTVDWTARSPAVNVDFRGFLVQANTSFTAEEANSPGTVYGNRNLTSSDVEFYGDQSEEGNVTYVTGENSGFAFNFTGAGISIAGPEAFQETSTWAVYFNETAVPPEESTEPYARYDVQGGQQRGGTIFFAAALPQGEHRVVVMRESGELGFSGATILWDDLYTNNTNACFGSCEVGESQRGKGVGTDWEVIREENGAGRGVVVGGTMMLLAVMLSVYVVL